MTTKEKVIHESRARILKEIEDLRFLIDATPMTEIISIRKEASEILKNGNDYARLAILGEKEKYWFSIAQKQSDGIDHIKRFVELRHELSDLDSELYRINNQ